MVRMLDDLQVNRGQQARLLDLSERTLQRALQGDLPKRLSVDQFTRMSLVTGIYKACASCLWVRPPKSG
ncbi:antitoxin Xre-like helix-turn-helix domain-containing protein [Deinococcus radiophilus]|uniref:antitoxin Xre-like helix-turn-helix domain-containing protein n=1 Tax=Deinococcus radiophilus TaxID=32062 RepID=UPI0036108A83